jgi:YD repeat-containing protein
MEGRKMTSKSKLWSFILILISGALLLFPAVVKADYAYKKAITIDHTKISATLTNFPVLVSITNDNDLKSHVTSPSGYDLVFKDGSGTQLNHELEKWDGSTGTLLAWVRVPTLSSTSDTVIYMWYGDSGVTTSQENKTGVWDSNFKGVYHLKETLDLTDSTAGSANLTNSNAAATSGKIGGGGSFGGSTAHSFLYISNPPAKLKPTIITVSAWVNPTENTSNGSNRPYIVAEQPQGAWNDGRGYFLALSGTTLFGVGNASGTWKSLLGSTTISPGSWYHLVGSFDNSQMKVYVNGVLDGTISYTVVPSYSDKAGYGPVPQTFYMGAQHNAYYTSNTQTSDMYFCNGFVDEVRISNIARSADWIVAEYRNQNSPSTFYTVGSEISSVDTTPPVVTAFVVPSLYNNLTAPISAFTATDNVGVTGYLVNEAPSTPSLNDPNWSASPQTQYTFSSDGNKTLYAWAKDAAGNISNSLSSTVLLLLGRRIYLYDELNRLIQVIYEDGRTVTYTYDASGNRVNLTND